MKRILVLKGQSRFDVLKKAVDEMAEGFRAKGYEVCIIDLTKEALQGVLELYGDYDFVFSCQGMLSEYMLKDGTPLLKKIKTVYFTWFFDDPLIYHFNRIKNIKYNHTISFLIDKEHVAWTKKVYPEMKLAYLPHGGFESKDGDCHKSIDIVFPANLAKKPVFEEIIKEPMPVETFLVEESIKILNKKPYLSVRKVLEIIVNSAGEELTKEMLDNLFRVIYYLDNYVRCECRYRTLETLLENNFTVHMIGEGNSEIANKYPNQLIVHGGLDSDETVELIGHAKILINPLNTFTEGIHDRIITAMLNKAVCFTPYNNYVQEEMGDRLRYIYMNDLDRLGQDVKEVLDNYQELSGLLEDNYFYAKNNHSWRKRGEQIVDYYESMYNVVK